VTARTCSVDGCTKPVFAREMCGTHYNRVRPNGSPAPRPCGFCGGPMPRGRDTSFHRECEPTLCFCEQPIPGGDLGTCKRCARPTLESLTSSTDRARTMATNSADAA
jgi:hypothetical protein